MQTNIFNEFEKFSMETWEKITIISPLTTYMKINEEGFTLDLVYIANRFENTFVLLDRSITDQEPETGADFFWNIYCNGKEHKLAIQAKRSMKPKSNYKGIKATINGITQIDRLMQYASKINYKPYYFFYNGQFAQTKVNPGAYVHTDEIYATDYNNGNVNLNKLGCTVLNAKDVNDLNMDGPRYDRITKKDNTRSLQQFLKDLCPPCSHDTLKMYETLNEKVSHLTYDSSKSYLYKKINEEYSILSSEEYSPDSGVIRNAIEHYEKIKHDTVQLNEEYPEVKYGRPRAIVFSNY